MVSGGEPFIYPNLFEIAEKHNDMAFMIYTNGILITDEVTDKIVEFGNVVPLLVWKDGKNGLIPDEERYIRQSDCCYA